MYSSTTMLTKEGKTVSYRTCEPPNPALVLIEPKFEGPSPRSSLYLEVDPQRDAQATVVVEVDQTIPTTWPSRVFPSHKLLIEVADRVVWFCCRDTNQHRL